MVQPAEQNKPVRGPEAVDGCDDLHVPLPAQHSLLIFVTLPPRPSAHLNVSWLLLLFMRLWLLTHCALYMVILRIASGLAARGSSRDSCTAGPGGWAAGGAGRVGLAGPSAGRQTRPRCGQGLPAGWRGRLWRRMLPTQRAGSTRWDSTVHYGAVLCSTVQYSEVQCRQGLHPPAGCRPPGAAPQTGPSAPPACHSPAARECMRVCAACVCVRVTAAPGGSSTRSSRGSSSTNGSSSRSSHGSSSSGSG